MISEVVALLAISILFVLELHTVSNQHRETKSSEGSTGFSHYEQFIQFSPEVLHAFENGEAIVALESTIITHGMPFPKNYETAKEVEQIVRDNGATPATIAIINGTIFVGLDDHQLLTLAQYGHQAIKTSRRDLSFVIASKKTGATTVSTTSLIANKVGIKVFVTGGLGGVHRGVEKTMDISADLTELGRTEIAVVCAGVKSILDIGRTLEVLETQGVAVFGYQTDYFPSFFTPSSGHKVPNRVNNPEHAAKVIFENQKLQLGSGIIFGVPIPDQFATEGKFIEDAIQQALKESEEKNIVGRDVTPFLLQRVNELTGGKSLEANIHLVKNNAVVGAKIASKFVEITKQQNQNVLSSNKISHEKYEIAIVGGAVVDLLGYPNKEIGKLILKTSNPGYILVKKGGVGRNVGEVLGRLNVPTLLITKLGNDVYGNMLLDYTKSLGLSTEGISFSQSFGTAVFNGLMDEEGELVAAIADMKCFDELTPQLILQHKKSLENVKIIVMDGNLPLQSMKTLAEISRDNSIPLIFEPTSVAKSVKPIQAGVFNELHYITPNIDELIAITTELGFKHSFSKEQDDLFLVQQLVEYILSNSGVKCVIAKMGARGVIVGKHSHQKIELKHFEPLKVDKIINVNGAGDSMIGCFIWGLLNNNSLDQCIQYGLECAKLSISSEETISPLITADYLN
eukprot:TRINITY_DN273_c0_g1_i4.p1 TRINITY_DN273_c0_g1~~TRINITY_DN273_c0_g1_i4.p1  ORF type:complete len:683 (+),score=133.54 TRINITY_DN273_c0_g1_i4:588-2636(+)